MNFIPLQGDDLGVLRNENYRVVQTIDGDITFSYTKQGDGMTLHLASSKAGLKRLRETLNAFSVWLFDNYDCKCLFGVIKKPSIERIAKKCGYKHIADDEIMNKIYVRNRDVLHQARRVAKSAAL